MGSHWPAVTGGAVRTGPCRSSWSRASSLHSLKPCYAHLKRSDTKASNMPADNELSAILNRRNQINDTLDSGGEVKQRYAKVSVYTEFTEFSRKEIKDFEVKFTTYNVSRSGTISLEELKVMMEKLGAPQTHLGLKAMIKEVDEDDDFAISFREFLMIFRKARAGELDVESGLGQLAKLSEVDVEQVGVKGLKLSSRRRLLKSQRGASLLRKSKKNRRRRGGRRKRR